MVDNCLTDLATMPLSNSTLPHQCYTAEACFACKSKKRKCDKQFPACSRCRKVDQECLYGIAADGVYGKIVPATNKDLSRASSSRGPQDLKKPSPSASCCRCNRLKKLCDKVLPSCSRCTRLGASCVYDRLERRRLLSSLHLFSLDAPPVSVVPLRLPYPVDCKPYIPSLVQLFQDRMGLTELAVESDSLAHHLRSSWIRHAMADPCLFHATLYAASAQLDTLRDMTAAGSAAPNPVTLYHQTETIAAVNRRIACIGGGE
ncbi:hypothetical protein BDV19DRAFT_374326 [Aspergillus venezuelensis]